MKKVIFIVAIVALIAGGFFFYNSSTIADDKDKCCNTNCPDNTNCDKKCDKTSEECKKMSEDCKKQCEIKIQNTEGQTQMKECPKTSCQQNPGCTKTNEVKKSGGCPKTSK
jgi:uncharacterized protein YxeA